MNSDELKLVFGFEPSGLLEKVILAPARGLPRTSPSWTGDDELEVGLTGSGLLVVGAEVVGISFLVIFGRVIFGNCPAVDWAKNDATAKAAISINDVLAINTLLVKTAFRRQILTMFDLILHN